MYAPLRVHKDHLGDWITACRRCGQSIAFSSVWEDAMIQGLGHMSMFHPQWPLVTEVPC